MANFKSLVNLTNDAKTVQVGERQKGVAPAKPTKPALRAESQKPKI